MQEKSGARNRLDLSFSRFQKKASASPKHKRKGSDRSRAAASNEIETSDDEVTLSTNCTCVLCSHFFC